MIIDDYHNVAVPAGGARFPRQTRHQRPNSADRLGRGLLATRGGWRSRDKDIRPGTNKAACGSGINRPRGHAHRVAFSSSVPGRTLDDPNNKSRKAPGTQTSISPFVALVTFCSKISGLIARSPTHSDNSVKEATASFVLESLSITWQGCLGLTGWLGRVLPPPADAGQKYSGQLADFEQKVTEGNEAAGPAKVVEKPLSLVACVSDDASCKKTPARFAVPSSRNAA